MKVIIVILPQLHSSQLWTCLLKSIQIAFHRDLPPWLSGLAISGRGAVKAWLAIRQGVGSYPTPAGMSSQVSA